MFRTHAARRVTLVLSLFWPWAARAADPEPGPPLSTLTGKPGGLTGDEVARRATVTSREVEEKKHEVEAAQARVDRTLADYFPRLGLSASYQRFSHVANRTLGTVVFAPDASGGPVAAGQPLVAEPLAIQSIDDATALSATLAVPVSDYVLRIGQAHRGAIAEREASEQSLRAAQRRAAYEARSLYYDWVRAELDAAVAEQNLELGNEHLAQVKSLSSAAAASPADVARVEATVAASELVLAQSQNLAVLQRERLAIAMHDSTGVEYRIGEDFRPEAGGPESYEVEPLVRRANRQRPEVPALVQQTAAYERQADVARSQAFPRIDAFAQAMQANPNPRYFPPEQTFHGTWALGAQLTYAPNDTATGLSEAAGASAKAAAADAERRRILDAIRAEVTQAVLAYRSAVVAIDTSARRLTAAETSYRARREQFLAGRATTVELTEAQTELFNASLEAVAAQVEIRRTRAQIAYVTGAPE